MQAEKVNAVREQVSHGSTPSGRSDEPSGQLMDMTMALPGEQAPPGIATAMESQPTTSPSRSHVAPAVTSNGEYIAAALDNIESWRDVKGGWSVERNEIMEDEVWTIAPVCGVPGNSEHYHVLVYSDSGSKWPVQSKPFGWQSNADLYMQEMTLEEGERAVVVRHRYENLTRGV